MSLTRNFANVGAATMVSRILGFVRDIFLAAILGAAPAADAFVTAFRIPNMFRAILAENMFNTAFVPHFVKIRQQEGEESARHFATLVVSSFMWVAIAITVLAEIFMPQLILLIATSFANDPTKFDLTILLARICFPYLICAFLMAAFGGILNGLGKFLTAALAPALLNMALIAALAGLVIVAVETSQAAIIISIAVLIGGLAQVALVAWALNRTGYFPNFTLPKFNIGVKKFWRLAIPVMFTGGVVQINTIVGIKIASAQDSAIAYLYYADRLYQLPLIVGTSLAVVALPELSRLLQSGEKKAAAGLMEKSLLTGLFFAIPAATALFLIAHPIMSTLFQRGAFTALAAVESARALALFALGMPAFVIVKVLQQNFFAHQDTKTPAIFATITILVNIGCSLLLFPLLGHVGIALATTISGWVFMLLFAVTLTLKGNLVLSKAFLLEIVTLCIASALMGLTLNYLGQTLADALSHEQSLLWRAGALGLLISSGGLTYILALHMSGRPRLKVWNMLLRR